MCHDSFRTYLISSVLSQSDLDPATHVSIVPIIYYCPIISSDVLGLASGHKPSQAKLG